MTSQFLITWFFFRECGFVWSVSEESEQVLTKWGHAGTTWLSDLIGLVLAFNFSPNYARSMACPRKASIWLGCWRLARSSCVHLPSCCTVLALQVANRFFGFSAVSWLQFWLAWNNHREVFPEMNSEFQFSIPKLSTTFAEFLWVKNW